MRVVENECCGCATDNYPCLGNSCPNRNVVRYYCDECHEEEELYRFDGEDLCLDCISKRLEKVDLEGVY